jgi:hypothetical protein
VQILSLEKAWGYDRNTLHADARHNVLFGMCIVRLYILPAHELEVNETIRDLLENDQIMLVPDFETMKQLKEQYLDTDKPPRNVLDVSCCPFWADVRR